MLTATPVDGALYGLSAEQCQRSHEQGFLSPLTLCGPDEMRGIYDEMKRTVLADGRGTWMRHLDNRALYDLCCRPGLVEPVASLIGPDLVAWRCRFMIKGPAAREIPWHQDAGYWKDLDPLINVSVWLALDAVDRENACVRVIPGSHRRKVAHIESGDNAHEEFALSADPKAVDESAAVYMELKAGQFLIFDENLLHGSGANLSERERAGFSVRITTTAVKIKVHPQTRPILIHGEDRFGYNKLASPPAAS